MEKVIYSCNLCGEKKDKEDLYSLYWRSDAIPQRYVIDKDEKVSHKHICTNCIAIVGEFYKEEKK